ncbi:hypothetical protein [Pseudomonas brassicacearum]|uniref:hypothetical protein n=1 Tax=Pseudomonas brassicacearum TaxID=930166 RepID=UPI0011CD5FD5|nr:hypothetical protein [Pseudomonas brassicacearum]
MKAIKLTLALWLGLLSLTALAEAGDNPECTAAEEAAQETYDQTAEAYNSGNKFQTSRYSRLFFEVYERNRNCPFIKELADKLNRRGITKTSVASSQNRSDYRDSMNSCPTCKIKIFTGGTGIGTGMGTNSE